MRNAETTLAIIRESPQGRGLKRCEPLESRMTGNFQVRFGGGCDTKLRMYLL
jgi:hypothetical protein